MNKEWIIASDELIKEIENRYVSKERIINMPLVFKITAYPANNGTIPDGYLIGFNTETKNIDVLFNSTHK